MILDILKIIINKIGIKSAKRPFGQLIKSYPPVILTGGNFDDPRAHSYFGGQEVIVTAQTANAFGFYHFSLNEFSYHPFIVGLKLANRIPHDTKNKDKLQHSEFSKVLKHYYNVTQNKNFSEYIGVDINRDYADVPPWGLTFPWDSRSPLESRKARQRRIQPNKGKYYGFNRFGGGSQDLIDDEVKRVLNVYQSIKHTGFRPECGSDHITGTVLLDGTDWRWVVGSGDHRMPVLSFLGIKTVPIRVIRVVRRDEVNLWPNVVNDVYSQSSALEVFDRFFEKRLSSVFDQWVDDVDNKILHAKEVC